MGYQVKDRKMITAAELETVLTFPKVTEFGAALAWELRTGKVQTPLSIRVSWCVTVHANGGDYKRLVANVVAQVVEFHVARVVLQAIGLGVPVDPRELKAQMAAEFGPVVLQQMEGMPAVMLEIGGRAW